jgi:phosphohistidine phosphatase
LGSRRLILLRHGQAQPEAPGCEDFDRVLTERGRVEAETMARLLVDRGWVPDCLIASPAERTRATATLVARGCGVDPLNITWLPELYSAGPDGIWAALTSRPASRFCVLICGHNPTLSQLASRLGEAARRHDLPTAGLATGIWESADWSGLRPQNAQDCEFAAPGESGL